MSDRRLILIIDDEPTIVRGSQLRFEKSCAVFHEISSGLLRLIRQLTDLVSCEFFQQRHALSNVRRLALFVHALAFDC